MKINNSMNDQKQNMSITVKELKERLAEVPDDVVVQILDGCGYNLNIYDTWLDTDESGTTFIIAL